MQNNIIDKTVEFNELREAYGRGQVRAAMQRHKRPTLIRDDLERTQQQTFRQFLVGACSTLLTAIIFSMGFAQFLVWCTS